MSRKERDRLKVVESVAGGRLRQVEATLRLRQSVRQVGRLLKRCRAEGDEGLVHRGRGRGGLRATPRPSGHLALASFARSSLAPTLQEDISTLR